MMESKYGDFLTVLLVIVIIAIIGCLAFGGYKVYQQFSSTQEANDYVNKFLESTKNNQIANNTISVGNTNVDANTNNTTNNENSSVLNQIEGTPENNGGTSSGSSHTYKGFVVLGTIEIPKINLSYPILNETGTTALETSVGMVWGPGPNKPGNTFILGHNYRDGRFFANNKNLSKGDKVYITDLSGKRLSYTIYDKFETTTEDSEFITRNTNGAREISLQTCTDDASKRLILLAKCDLD